MVMAGPDRVVRLEHLPDDFLEDVASMPAVAVELSMSSALPSAASAKLEDVELQTIQRALDEHRGNVSAAARALGVSRNTIYRKLQK